MGQLKEIDKDLQNHEFNKLMEDLYYEKFGEGNRHGSYEITWSKKPEKGDGDNIAHFVVLAATPEALTPQYTVEVWGGADNGEGFARILFASFKDVAPGELTNNNLVSAIKKALSRAAEKAESMTLGDLVNRHVTTPRIKETKNLWEHP